VKRLFFVTLFGALLFGGRAFAQRGVDAHLYSPAVDGYGLFATERAQTAPKFTFGFSLSFDFAQNPLKLGLYDSTLMMPRSQSVIDWQATIHLGISFGLTDWLELALDLPASAQHFSAAYGDYGSAADPHLFRTGFYAADPYTNIPPPDAGPLDMRIALKATFFRKHQFGLGAVTTVTLPFGDDSAFLGDSGFTFRPNLVADYTRGPLTVAANVGAIVRQNTTVLEPHDVATGAAAPALLIDAGHELTWSVGAGYRFVHWAQVLAEVYGYTPLTGVTRDHTADVLGGVRFFPKGRVAVTLAAGADVIPSALRHDDFRVLAAIAWLPGATASGSSDIDRDGIPDAIDLCPNEPEDKDGFEDQDGCPDPDNDGDGIPDGKDLCPNEPEDKDGFEDQDGCPDPDNDHDGVADAQDRCPNEAEDRDGFQDDDGCPDADNDGDGIPDAVDRCPNEPETRNGVDDEDGCPDTGGRMITGELVKFPELIGFATGQSTISPAQSALLEKLADRLKAHPEVKRLRLEGHADPGEPARKQVALAQARAEAVRTALMQRGVAADRLQAVGYGATRPLEKGRGAEAAARNRSVELIVVEQ
jgi:outer membrane protein OmpA-like peptidoglycan-associated protein